MLLVRLHGLWERRADKTTTLGTRAGGNTVTHLEGSGTADDFMAQRRLVRVVRVIVLRSHKRRVSVAILLRAVSDALTHLVGQLSLVRIIIEPTHGVYYCCVKSGY